MKISGLTTRLLSIDTAPRYRGGVVPAGLPPTWYFPLVTIHTDAGVDGYSMAYGPHSDGKTCAALLHDSYYPQIAGADPTQIEALWQKLFSASAIYTIRPTRWSELLTSRFGISWEKSPGSPLRPCSGNIQHHVRRIFRRDPSRPPPMRSRPKCVRPKRPGIAVT